MSNRKPADYLAETASKIKAKEAAIKTLDTKLVENDIAARRIEADIGWAFAQQVDQIEAALKAEGRKLNVDQWCKKALGVEVGTMRRRKLLFKRWKTYDTERRKVGQCGQSGLFFALSLVRDAEPKPEQSGTRSPVRSSIATESSQATAANQSIRGCQFITGDALVELPKLAAQSVHTAITSPPYWPPKRLYGGTWIGFEETLDEYLIHLVAVLREVQRVLRDDGTLWVNIDDSYEGGNLLLIPARLAIALQSDGWVCRSEIIWHKSGGGRPEPDRNQRPSKDYEKLLMFTKRSNGYHYDGDSLRVPLVRPFSAPARKKAGMIRRDFNRGERIYANPMGRAVGSVWEITPASVYRGSHPATMPLELVRRCLLLGCPENGVVVDPFGGAGTTALAALRLGRRAISIEISEDYTSEARERIAAEFCTASEKLAAD